MRRVSLVSTMAAALLAGLSGTAAAAGSPTGNDQHFVGLVKKGHSKVVVYVACPGPSSSGQTGHPTGGQSLVVTKTRSDKGYTGNTGGGIFARFATNPSSEGVLFTTYRTPEAIPTSWSVPCSGPGTMVFQPIAIVGSGRRVSGNDARPDIVSVLFENVAV